MKTASKTSYNLTPTKSKLIEIDNDIRAELPFQLFENLVYIGIVSQQSWHVQQHYHDHYELCYVDKGQGWFSIEGNLYPVVAGDLFLTKPQEVHQGAAELDFPYRLYYLGFQLEQMRKLEIDFSRLGLYRVVRDQDGLVKRMCDTIFQEIQTDKSHSNWLVQGCFLQMLVHVIRRFNGSSRQTDPFSLSPVIMDLLIYLHKHVRFHQSIDDLSNRFHLSRTHLDREFKRSLGVTLGHYIRSLCLDRAKYYLRETSDSITSISENLGMASIHKFSMFFKRMTGVSPLEYRKRMVEEPGCSKMTKDLK